MKLNARTDIRLLVVVTGVRLRKRRQPYKQGKQYHHISDCAYRQQDRLSFTPDYTLPGYQRQ